MQAVKSCVIYRDIEERLYDYYLQAKKDECHLWLIDGAAKIRLKDLSAAPSMSCG